MNKIKMKQRDANMELLRLLAMLMVIVYHFFGHTFIQETINDIVIVKIVSGFVYIGVNIFVLISGFYGIRFSIKGIVSLCFVTAFYNLVGYLFHIWHGGLHFGKSLVLLTVFPISHTMAWFIVCYMMLYLLAPILNRASEYLNEKEFSYVLGLLTIVNVYFGYFWQNSYCSVDGYTVAQFVYIYMIGRFIKQYVPCDATRKVWMRKWLVTIYVGCSLLWGGITIIKELHPFEGWHPMSYNNPLLIISAIAVLLTFRTVCITSLVWSKNICWLASGVLAAYMIQDATYFREIVYPIVRDMNRYICGTMGVSMEILILFVFSMFFMLVCILLDLPRRYLFGKLNKLIEKYNLEKYGFNRLHK